MNYNLFNYNNERIVTVPGVEPELVVKQMEKGLSALPMVLEDKMVLAYANKMVVLKEITTDTVLWSRKLPDSMGDALLYKQKIFLSNHSSLFVLDCNDGSLITKIDHCNPNLVNAVVYDRYIIWPTFIDNENQMITFDTEEMKVTGKKNLPGIASFMLLYKDAVILNSYPDKLYSMRAITGELNWKQIITQKNPAEEFVNDYPFIMNNTVCLTLFPDTMKSYDLLTGEVKWEFKSGTGINSFAARFSNENEIAFFSGRTIFYLDSQNGELLKKIDLDMNSVVSSGTYQLSFSDNEKAVFYSYTLKKMSVIDLNTAKEITSFKLKAGVKYPPFIANNKLFVVDKDGNLYY